MYAKFSDITNESQEPESRSTKRPTKQREALHPDKIYSRNEAAAVTGIALITLIRAYDNGHLKVSRVGSRVLIRGQQLLDWIEAGGKTGHPRNKK